MTTGSHSGPSPYDCDGRGDAPFAALHSVVVTIVRLEFSGTIGPLDRDDVEQETALRVWNYWLTRPILNPPAFIRRTVKNVVIDLMRKFKPWLYQDVPYDESGEICEDMLLCLGTGEEIDPEWQIIEAEQEAETIGRVVDSIARLHERQRDATVFTLRSRLDEWNHMAVALEARGIHADCEWPDDPIEKQRLQASYSPARHNIARHMSIELSLYKRP